MKSLSPHLGLIIFWAALTCYYSLKSVDTSNMSGVALAYNGKYHNCDWRANIPHYARMRYQKAHLGINLACYRNQQQSEYDFVVAQGADPGRIKLAFEDAPRVGIDKNRGLALRTAAGEKQTNATAPETSSQ